VNLGLVLHSFKWEGQVKELERAVEKLKKGEMGTSVIRLSCKAVNDGTGLLTWHEDIPVHNEQTFRKMVVEVEARTGTKWDVDVKMDSAISKWNPKHR